MKINHLENNHSKESQKIEKLRTLSFQLTHTPEQNIKYKHEKPKTNPQFKNKPAPYFDIGDIQLPERSHEPNKRPDTLSSA